MKKYIIYTILKMFKNTSFLSKVRSITKLFFKYFFTKINNKCILNIVTGNSYMEYVLKKLRVLE